MFRLRAPMSAFFLICAALSGGAAQAAPPVEAFGRLPAVSDVSISPDGKRVAMLQAAAGEIVAVIYKVGAPANTRPVVINPEKGKVRKIEWANNERLLIWLSITHQVPGAGESQTFEWERIVSIKADGSGFVFLFKDDDFRYVINAPFLLSTLPQDPDHILMIQLDANRYTSGGTKTGSMVPRDAFRGLSVYKVNVNDGREERAETAQRTTDGWIVGSGGAVRIRIDRDGDTTIFAREPEGGAFSRVASYDEKDPRSGMSFRGFGRNPDKVYVLARRGSDKRGVYTYDLTAGKIGGKVFLHDRYDVQGVVKDRYTDRIVGVWYVDHMRKSVFWDKTWASIHKKLQNVFKESSVSILSMSRDRNAVAILVEAPDNAGTYYLYDAKARRVSSLSERYPALTDVNLGAVMPISYKARDGLTIPAYLTLPPGRKAENLPLVVLPHGGPQARDTQSFDWWASFYASRGYAVLQPNYRGSSGYGAKFIKAGHGEFGGKMQDDLTDGVEHLVAEGIAHPERICIVGASYGGYAALAGATLTPDVYACAVSVNGVSDLVEMMGAEVIQARQTGQGEDAFSVQYWERWLGSRHVAQDKMVAASPARNAGQVQAPVLLIHGRDDTVVRFSQSKLMADALRDAGKSHRLIELEGEDHWLSKAESRIRVLKETEAFLEEHIGG